MSRSRIVAFPLLPAGWENLLLALRSGSTRFWDHEKLIAI